MAQLKDQIRQALTDFVNQNPDATDAELDAIVARVTASQKEEVNRVPETVSTVTGMTPAQAQARGEAGMQGLQAGAIEAAQETPIAGLRYGVPLASAALTSGMSLVPAALTGGAALGLSEAGAQALEKMFSGTDFRQQRILANTALGFAAPLSMAQTNRLIGAGVDNIKFGQGVVNFLANTGTQTAASEVARAIEGEKSLVDYLNPFGPTTPDAPSSASDYLLRFGLPVATSAVGTRIAYKNASAQQAEKRFNELTKSRFGGPVMVSELIEGYSPLEQKTIADGIPWLRTRVLSLTGNVGGAIVEHFQGSKNTEDLAKALIATGAVDRIQTLEKQAAAAASAKAAADARAAEAKRLNSLNRFELEEEARKAGIQAAQQYTVFEQAVDGMLGIPRGDLLVGPEQRRLAVQDMAMAAKGAVTAGRNALYEAAGVGINETVVTKDGILASLRAKIPDDVARTKIELVLENVAKRNPAIIQENGNISRGGFLELRNEMVSAMKTAGDDAKYANRIASNAYSAIVDASETYMGAMNPKKLERLQRANASNRSIEEVRSGFAEDRAPVIDLLEEGKIGDVVAIVEKEGAGRALREIDAYASAMEGLGDETSRAAAKVFRAKTFGAIKDNLMESSLLSVPGEDRLASLVDVPLLAKRLDSLRRRGFPTAELRLGTEDEIKALARVSAEIGSSMSVEKVNSFLNDAAKLGTGKAEARLRYEQAYRDYLIAPSQAEQSRQLAILKGQAKKAGITLRESEELLARARQDPLAQLFNATDLGINIDTSKNSRWTWALLDSGENNVRRLMAALDGKGSSKAGLTDAQLLARAQLGSNLRKSVARDVFFNAIEAASGPDEKTLRLQQITNLFYGSSDVAERQRKSLIALVGRETFNDYKDKFAEPVRAAVATAERLGEKVYNFRPELTVGASAISYGAGAGEGAAGKIGAQRGKILGGWFDDISKVVRNNRINEAYLLFVEPTTAKAYRDSMYNLNRFLNSSPRNLVAYRLAQQEDDAANGQPTQGQPTR
jgi:hypothetical protein